MVLQHCSNCDGRHPPPLDEVCPFPTCEQPAPKRTTRRTRRSPSLSPPPPPKRGRGQPRGSMSPSLSPPPPPPPKRGRGQPLGSKGKGKKAPPLRHQSPEASFDAQDQPDSPHSSACPTPRDSGMQPPCSPQPVDPQVAAIQAIADQLARMQQEAKAYQAAAARDREADRQEMLRRTVATQPAPGPSPPDVAFSSPLQVQAAASCLWGPSDFVPPQFAVPTHCIGEEQLRRAGLDPQLLQQISDPAAALRADAHSAQQAHLILRGARMTDPASTGGLQTFSQHLVTGTFISTRL